jgi:hypothetical protein
VGLQRVGQEIGENRSALRAHVDSRVDDPTFLLPELKQKFRRVMSNLKEVGISSFRFSTGRSKGGSEFVCVVSDAPFPDRVLIDLGLAFVNA